MDDQGFRSRPGTYGYKFLVDGRDWVFDPKNPGRKTVDGVENSSLDVRDDGNTRSTAIVSPSATPLGQTSMLPAQATSPASVVPANTKDQIVLLVTPGEISSFEAPLSAKERADAIRNGNPPVTTAKLLLGVPNGFD